MNEVMNTLLSHRSIRVYENKPLEDEILDQIIKAVQAAPNWVNLQHVSVIAIKDQERREKFSALCGNQDHIAQAPVFLVFCADFYRTWLACQSKGQPFDETVSQADNLIVGANEVGIALGTAVAAAESFGLGTVPIGDIRLHALEAIQELNLPKYVLPLLGLCIGYPAENPGIKPRLPREAVCFEEQYNQDLKPLLAQYDEIYAHYLKERPWNRRVGSWTQLAADFYRPPYNHYPEILKMLRRQGFFSGNLEEATTPVFNFETKTVRLNSGYDMPIAGLGTYALSDETCINSVNALLESGGRLIDTASFYGTEKSVGEAVRNSDVPREEIFVTTKLYPNQFSDPVGAINEALETLNIEYIGSGNPDHIKENQDIFGFELTEEEMEQIVALDRGGKHEWY